MHLPAEHNCLPQGASSTEGELEFGSFASETTDAAQSRRLIVATFNIRYAVGSLLITGSLLRRAGVARPARRRSLVEGNIQKAASLLSRGGLMPAPDIVALQEADRRTRRAGGVHVARELARSLRMSYVHAPAQIPRGEKPKDRQWYLNFEEPLDASETGDTGVALLSRIPLVDIARIELPWSDCPWRPRLALAASVPFAESRLRIFNLHIDPHGSIDERLEQHRAVLARIAHHTANEPLLLLGDFNTLTKEARDATRHLLEEHSFHTPMPSGVATWRAGLVRLHTDWIFTKGLQVRRWGVARQRGISDHWPVWAEVAPDE